MSSSFFLKKEGKANKRRKQTAGNSADGKKSRNNKKGQASEPLAAKKRTKKTDDEEIPSDDEYESGIDGAQGSTNLVFSSDEAEEETAQDKRLRLAKQYLDEIKRQEEERAEDSAIHDHVSQRLQTEYLDSVGRLRRNIAAKIQSYDEDNIVILKHKKQHLPVCCIALSTDGEILFTGAKTQYVLKWNLTTRRVEGIFDVQPTNEDPDNGLKRRSHVIVMCLSSDMKFLALSDGGHNIQIWCPKELKHLKTFRGHRDVVTALVFRKDTHELYSGSKDRAVKIWSLDEMAYVESLFGHQSGITGIDALSRERAITSGGVDCSLRIWKITEESQLIYNGHQGSIEAVKFINEEHFISAGVDGCLSVWSALKKKPLFSLPLIHGVQNNGEANWISAITCVVNTDLIATGSCDGFIRLFQTTDNCRKIQEIFEIPMTGFINALAFNADGTKLYAAIGQEHRLGRWWRLPEAKNKIVVIELSYSKAASS